MGVAFSGARRYDMQHERCISQSAFYLLRRNQPMAVNTETPNDTKSTDRIEKRVVLRAPRTRVWRALTNAAVFDPEPGAKLCRVCRGQAGPGQAQHTELRACDAGTAG